jgi:hypothetical protein
MIREYGANHPALVAAHMRAKKSHARLQKDAVRHSARNVIAVK